VTERRKFAEQLEHMALHDPLTGLLNRRGFDDELAGHVARCRRYGPDGALLVLDLDHFKRVNDTLGHHAGDGLIAAVARLLRSRLRETDVLARLGGDEFAVLLPRGGLEEAGRVGSALLRALAEEAAESLGIPRRRPVTGSIGIAAFTEDATPQDVLAAADIAMYDAKDAGRDQLAVSSAPLRESRVQARISWADRVERALDEERLELWAQPIVDLRSGRAAHQELLLRMREDDRVVPPAAFLEVAERFGFIEAIDTWVVNGAVDILSQRPDLVLEVNVSGPSMASDSFHRTVDRVVGSGDIDPTHLIFEVTETAAIANIGQAKRFAEQLRSLGCRFALDDFGAGFGSFYYLKHLPFDFLKIDGEFVRNYLASRTDRVLVDAVVGLAQELGKQTIAEFVTDADIAMALAGRGVDFGQGHHLGAPSPSAELLSPAT
jgi:diguanylate cyclase (GGDEF)-like protein